MSEAIPFAKVGDISATARLGASALTEARNYVSDDDILTLKAKLVPAGSTLFAKIGEAISQNFRVQAGVDLLIDNNAMAAIPGAKVDPRYLYRFLQTVNMYSMASTTSVPSLRRSDLDRIPLPLPPLPEQRRIASILDQADALRAKRRSALEQLDLARSEFLGQISSVSSHRRHALRELSVLITKGTTPTSVGLKFEQSGIAFMRAQNILDGEVIVDSTTLHIGESSHAALGRSQILPRDVLVTIAGTIGRVGIVSADAPPMNCNQAVAIVRLRPDVSATYVSEWLRSPEARRQMFGSSVTATIANLSLAELGKISVPVLPAEMATEFERKMTDFDIARGLQRLHLYRLDELFASLQQRAFSGQL